MFCQLKDNEHSIKEFSKKFIVDEKLVKEYVNHLHEIEVRKEKRMKKNKEKSAKERCKIYEDYNWTTLCKDGTLKKLKVVELEKYLTYHDIKLPKNKQQKSDKVDIIQAHVGRKIYDQMITSADRGQNNLNYSDTDSDESGHSVDSVIVGARAHSWLIVMLVIQKLQRLTVLMVIMSRSLGILKLSAK